MPQWVDKIREYLFGAIGGFLSGAIANTFVHALVLQLVGYQEGWYRQFAYYAFAPVIVLLVYVALIAASDWRWRFAVAAILVAPVFLTYLYAKLYLPLEERYAWIEFTALWIMLAQLAGIFLVASWVLFWITYDRMGSKPRTAVRSRKPKKGATEGQIS